MKTFKKENIKQEHTFAMNGIKGNFDNLRNFFKFPDDITNDIIYKDWTNQGFEVGAIRLKYRKAGATAITAEFFLQMLTWNRTDHFAFYKNLFFAIKGKNIVFTI